MKGVPPNGHDLGPSVIAATEAPLAGEKPGVPPPIATVMVPVFEVIIPSALAGVTTPAYHFKVWGDGTVEGFQALAADVRRIAVVNRIPALLDQMFQPLREYVDDVNGAIGDLAGEQMATEDQAQQATSRAST